MNRVVFSSRSDDWATPDALFRALDREFGFTIDTAAEEENAKCSRFYSIREDGLKMPWAPNEVIFCNPPYGRRIGLWVKKAYESALAGATVVMVLPSRTGTKWFHSYVLKGEIRFIRGRLKFGNSLNAAPFDSMIVVFRPYSFRLVAFENPGRENA